MSVFASFAIRRIYFNHIYIHLKQNRLTRLLYHHRKMIIKILLNWYTVTKNSSIQCNLSIPSGWENNLNQWTYKFSPLLNNIVSHTLPNSREIVYMMIGLYESPVGSSEIYNSLIWLKFCKYIINSQVRKCFKLKKRTSWSKTRQSIRYKLQNEFLTIEVHVYMLWHLILFNTLINSSLIFV